MYIYPENLKSKAIMWMWELKDLGIIAVCAIVSIFIISQTGFMLPLAITAGYAFLTIRIDDVSIMMLILIGDKIREARERKNLTQMKLAELAELSTITISNMESGRFLPNLKNIIVLSNILNISIDFLVADGISEINETYIHEINVKLNKMDEVGLKHINQYIDLYNEMTKER